MNLMYYPFSYMFRAPPMLLPHESTVAHAHAHEQKIRNGNGEQKLLVRTKSTVHASKDAAEVLVHTRPTTPTTITHSHDEDLRDDDDESDKKSEKSDEEAK